MAWCSKAYKGHESWRGSVGQPGGGRLLDIQEEFLVPRWEYKLLLQAWPAVPSPCASSLPGLDGWCAGHEDALFEPAWKRQKTFPCSLWLCLVSVTSRPMFVEGNSDLEVDFSGELKDRRFQMLKPSRNIWVLRSSTKFHDVPRSSTMFHDVPRCPTEVPHSLSFSFKDVFPSTTFGFGIEIPFFIAASSLPPKIKQCFLSRFRNELQVGSLGGRILGSVMTLSRRRPETSIQIRWFAIFPVWFVSITHLLAKGKGFMAGAWLSQAMLFGRLSACGLQRTASKIGISPKIRAITQFKPSKLNLYSVQKTHGVKWVITCPTKLGFPMRRRRTFTFGFLWRNGCGWALPLMMMFRKNLIPFSTKPYSFLVMFICWQTPIALKNFACEKAAQRGKCLPPDFAGLPMSKYLQCLLPPGAMLRLSQYESARPQREGLAGHYMVDLDHNISFGPRSGPEMPALDTHPTIYSFQMERLVLAEEMLAAQGIDMFEDLAGFSRNFASEGHFLVIFWVRASVFCWEFSPCSNVRCMAHVCNGQCGAQRWQTSEASSLPGWWGGGRWLAAWLPSAHAASLKVSVSTSDFELL